MGQRHQGIGHERELRRQDPRRAVLRGPAVVVGRRPIAVADPAGAVRGTDVSCTEHPAEEEDRR